MPAAPELTCPNCGRKLEYHATIEMTDPPIGKIDTAYCVLCARLFERIRETATFYDSTLWPPLCRVCRQPVVFASASGDPDEAMAIFICHHHQTERWTWTGATERWTRVEPA
jgi:hypothetical protein